VIVGTWSKLSLDYVPHKDTEMNVIKPSEEVPPPHTDIDIDTQIDHVCLHDLSMDQITPFHTFLSLPSPNPPPSLSSPKR
jgi:hypothetical protein